MMKGEEHNEEVNLLIYRFLTDEITDDELVHLREMLEQSESDRILFSEMSAIWSAAHTLEDPELEKKGKQTVSFLKNKRNSEVCLPIKQKRSYISFLGIAAVIILISGLSIFLSRDSFEEQIPSSVISYVNEDEYVTPYTLQDSSVIWLGPHSSFQFRLEEKNGEIHRLAHVDGSAYLEVAKDSTRPFIVNADDFAVRVLGTKFIVESHPDSSATKVYLQEGSVGLQTLDGVKLVRLVENQRAVFDKTSKDIQVDKMEVDSYVNGQFNKIALIDKTLDEIVVEINKIYDTSIIYDKSLQGFRKYKFNFMRTDPLEEVLAFLEQLTGQHFTIKGE